MLSASEANELFIIHADNYSETDLNVMYHGSEKNRDNNIEATILGFNSEDYKSFGFMQIDDKNVLQNFIEKPKKGGRSCMQQCLSAQEVYCKKMKSLIL